MTKGPLSFALYSIIIACLLWVIPVQANARPASFVNEVPGRLVDVSILDQWGQPYPVVYSSGKYYLAGEMGRPYVVRLNNRSAGRVLAVVSVDGVNVVTGQTASPDQTGYVLPAYGQTDIQGWRKSMGAVASFEFSRQAMSYASRTGRPANVGVIGVAVFEEARPRPVFAPPAAPPEVASDRAGAASAESAPGAARQSSESLGTGHGAPVQSHATLASFIRASRTPAQVTRLEYDSQQNLQRRGVWPVHRDPQPFPGFVPDPWR